MNDRTSIQSLELILKKLHAQITVLTSDDCSLVSTDTAIADDRCTLLNGHYVISVRGTDCLLICDENVPGAEDILIMASSLAYSVLSNSSSRSTDVYDVYRSILSSQMKGSDLQAAINEYKLPDRAKRCVFVFHSIQQDSKSLYYYLNEYTPIEGQDILVQIDKHTVALIKDVELKYDDSELIEYAQAVQETLMNDTACCLQVGIGSEIESIEDLGKSFRHAKSALDIGEIFHPENRIHVYKKLILERLLTELPSTEAQKYHELLFNRRNQRLFNDEMLQTISMFFQKDLNLSDTARQLYIHRNTLVYRLDKVQKTTGLDLRRFDDAVTFKVLSDIGKLTAGKTNDND